MPQLSRGSFSSAFWSIFRFRKSIAWHTACTSLFNSALSASKSALWYARYRVACCSSGGACCQRVSYIVSRTHKCKHLEPETTMKNQGRRSMPMQIPKELQTPNVWHGIYCRHQMVVLRQSLGERLIKLLSSSLCANTSCLDLFPLTKFSRRSLSLKSLTLFLCSS